jgi:hypothetical protein
LIKKQKQHASLLHAEELLLAKDLLHGMQRCSWEKQTSLV